MLGDNMPTQACTGHRAWSEERRGRGEGGRIGSNSRLKVESKSPSIAFKAGVNACQDGKWGG